MKKLFTILFFLTTTVSVFAQEKKNKFDATNYQIDTIGFINTEGSDVASLLINDEFYFSAIRESYFNKPSKEKKNKAFYDMYSTQLDAKGYPESTRELVPGFGAEYHEGPACYCAKTGEMFITLSNVIKPDILHKIISIKKYRLRLAIMKKKEKRWYIAEEFPFNDENYSFAHPAINKNGDTLIFVSNMESSIGENDLYMSVRKNGNWSTPVNLGQKINTKGNEMFPTFIADGVIAFSSDGRKDSTGRLDLYYTNFPEIGEIKPIKALNSSKDDFEFIVNQAGTIGYFSSNREGTKGYDDIFRVELNTKIINGLVVNDKTNTPVAEANVIIKTCKGKEVENLKSNSEGKFSFEYPGGCFTAEATHIGYIKDDKKIENDTNDIELRLVPREHRIVSIDASTNIPVAQTYIYCKDKQLGVTDSNGELLLSQPIPYSCTLKAKATGYLDQSFNLSPADPTRSITTDTVRIPMYRKELNKSFVLKNIYYDFNKWNILPESEEELNKLVQIMIDNPDIQVELGSHTDSRGSDKYNMWLSQKRSESAVKYIISKGISKDRIVAKGYGETQLVNKCKNGVKCSKAEHRKNRRTEFKIIGL